MEQRNQLMNLQKRIARRGRIDRTAAAIGGNAGVDLVHAIQNTMVALNTPVRGGRLSAEAEGLAWHDRYVSGVTRELERAGLFQAARNNAFEREWGRELYEMSMRDAGREANPGVTGNQAAIGPVQTSCSIFEFVFVNLGIVFFDTATDLLQWQKHVQLLNVPMILNARPFWRNIVRFC